MTMKVSIILPVYNASATICRMLDSLKAQTLTDFEALMIDDGSTDGTGAILDQYVLSDSRFKVVHKKNGGVSAARQTGIELAQGEYVIHADSDDWVDSTMLEEMYAKAKAEDADVVIADFYSNTDTAQTLCRQQPSALNPDAVLRDLFQQLHGSCWNKLVRRVCYSKYRIRFPEGINHCEDLLTWVQLFQHGDVRVAYLPKAFYHYYANTNSITRRFTRQTYEMRLKFLACLKEMLHVAYAPELLKQVSFGIFTEGIIFHVLSSDEIKQGLRQYKPQIASLKSPKWKLGFLMLRWGMQKWAYKLIHY